MASSEPNYDAISVESDGQSPPVPITPPPTFWERVKDFEYKRFLRTHLAYILTCLIGFFLILGFIILPFLPDDNIHPLPTFRAPVQPGIPWEIIHAERIQYCSNLNTPPAQINQSPLSSRTNPRAPKDVQSVLLTNAVVWDGEGNVQQDVDILMVDGIIQEIRKGIVAPNAAKIINVQGHVVSPGLVDMHTHLGVMGWPSLKANVDLNEETDPLTPFARVLDAFDPSDKAIRIVASGGVTTALVMPGSGNIMGGEAYAFKLRQMPTSSNEDMLVQAGQDIDSRWRWMKMACGENPKKVYGGKRMPMTRLGEAFLFRQRIQKAQKLKEQQDDWCNAANELSQHNSGFELNRHFPTDLSLESLVALLRGKVLLNIHCYETHDIEAMVRHSLEFNFTISAFHHALEAYRIPDILRRAPNNITVATFADHWGFKKEAFGGIPESPRILYEAGLPVALKTDHPVINSQHLIFEAAKATHYGLPAQEAFKAVTSVPAKSLGLGHRVGSLKEGYDADVVIWDREPLALGAAPLQVFVDGVALFDEPTITPPKTVQQKTFVSMSDYKHIRNLQNYVLTNVGSILLNDDMVKASENSDKGLQITVRDGKIVCSGSGCVDQAATVFQTSDYETIDIQGGYVLPGIIGVGTKIGMVEIPSEGSTGDGVNRSPTRDISLLPQAVDGLKLGTRHLEEAYKGGVMTIISEPLSNQVLVGVSAAFKTSADSLLSDGALIAPAVALHLQIGNNFKSDFLPTVSSQISYIRQLLLENRSKPNYVGQAARGEIPTIVNVHNKDEIASVIRLKLNQFPKLRMAILGGTEAHMVASHLAEAGISVILRPALCTPSSFDTAHCLTGPPLTDQTAAHILFSHGVKLGVGVSYDGWTRNLAWDAGWLSVTSKDKGSPGYISESEAIKMVTMNLQEIYGLKDTTQSLGDEFVVWSGSPLDIQSRPLFYHSDGLDAIDGY
ncbi:hypothetical protein CLU79DRAFT_771604 [Phycomyces nitens]|nr:hypothetical protein CLU79DRAFT_771604 [Phycomyces nitens]